MRFPPHDAVSDTGITPTAKFMKSIRSRTAPLHGVVGGVIAIAALVYGCNEAPVATKRITAVVDSTAMRAEIARRNSAASIVAGGLTRCHWPADPGSPGYCPIVVTFTPTTYQGHIDGIGDQFDPVTIDFSAPVWGLTIEPSGAVLCPPIGTLSPIQVYDSTGVLAASESFKLVDPINGWECGSDNISNQVDTVAFKGGIKRVVITAPSPASWPFAPDPTITAYMSQSYGASLNYYTLDPTKLTLSASKNSGFVADTITFTASRPDGGGFTVSSWKWVADPGAAPPPGYTEKLPVSSCRTATSCRYTPGASGTMWVYGSVNSRADSASQHVAISTWSLSLTASPIAVHTGQSVAFKPAWSDGATVVSASWSWRADAGTAKTKACNASPATCTVAVMESGTMTATSTRSGVAQAASFHVRTYTSLSLTVDRSSVNYGDTVTFTPNLDATAGGAARWRWVASSGPTDNASCGNGIAPCRKKMIGSGTMWVYTSATSGQGDSANIAVTVNAPTLTITGSPDYVYSGELVSFQAASPNETVDVVSWSWADDPVLIANRAGMVSRLSPAKNRLKRSTAPSHTANIRTPTLSPLFSVENGMLCVAHSSTCSDSVMASGVMHVRAIVNGYTVEDSVHVTVANLSNLAAPPEGIAQPDGDDGPPAEPPSWCPADEKAYLRSNAVRARMKMLYDSTAAEHLEHGSFVFADSLTSTLSNGPVIEGDSTSMAHRMTPPPTSACSAMHAHPDGKQYKLGPSGDDQFYSSFYKLSGFVITKGYIFYMDTDGRARAVARRGG